jgi:chromosomal replication initiator protein
MNETVDIQNVWEEAKQIYVSTIKDTEVKNKAERYLSMVTSVIGSLTELTCFTSTKLAADTLAMEFGNKMKNSLCLAGADEDIVLNFKYDPTVKSEIVIPEIKREEAPVVKVAEAPRIHQEYSTFVSTMPLIKSFTFDEFVRGPSNSFAVDAAIGVVNNHGKAVYNPLFIYGGTGLGKTHLMHAIGNEIKKRNPSLAICYLTAEMFLNQYIDLLQNKNSLKEFRDRYRSVDVLLIDDIQFLQRGKNVQEEFFNTFQALQQSEKQIVMTSDVAPKNLPQLEERLISRFEGGLVQEIESPGYETRLAILKKKAENYKIYIPNEAMEFIAENIKSHVRAMEGALGKISIFLNNNKDMIITRENLTKILEDLIRKEQSLKMLTIGEIQNTVSKKFNVTMEQMLSTVRTQSIVTPRQLAMYIARKLTTKSLEEIAKEFDKSHATIIHGVKTIKERLANEPELKAILAEIVALFGYKMSDVID